MGPYVDRLLALNAAKHDIREAINAKGGGPLSPGDPLNLFAPAIEGIPTGGEVPSLEELLIDYHRVMFIDWDGTILKDVMVKDGDPVEAPETPTKWSGLTFAGWTHSSSSLNSVTMDMSIGATYTMGAGVKAVISLKDGQACPMLSISLTSGICTIHWGDGTSQTVSATGSVAPHSYTDGLSEHVIKVVFSGSGSVNEYDSYLNTGYYGVFTAAGWKSDKVNAFGWPANTGSTPVALTYRNTTTKDRYCSIRAYVIPGGNASGALSLHVPVSGRFLYAASENNAATVTLKNEFQEGQYSNAIIQRNGLVIPILMNVPQFGRNIFGIVGRSRYVQTSNAYYSSSSSVSVRWPRVVVNCAISAYADDSHVVAVKGSLKNNTGTGDLTFYVGTLGLERLLHTLPERTTARIITIKYPGTGVDKLSAAITAELAEKGYTVAYSAYI